MLSNGLTDTHDNTVTLTAHARRGLIIGWQYWGIPMSSVLKPTQKLFHRMHICLKTKLVFTNIEKRSQSTITRLELFKHYRQRKYNVGSRNTSLIHQCAHVIYILESRSPLEKTGRLGRENQPLPREKSKSEENTRNNLPNRSQRYPNGTVSPHFPGI